MTQEAPALSTVQKTLAACGIFLFVGGVSWTYAQMKPFSGAQQPTVVQNAVPVASGSVLPQEELLFEPNVPAVLNPQVTMPQTTVPAVSTGALIQDQPVTTTQPVTPATPTTLLPQILAQQIVMTEDLAWDRSVFDNIFPFANLVSMQSWQIESYAGQKINGRLTSIHAIDPSINDVYAYILMLAKRDTSGKISITEKTFGSTKVFFYNDLDKKENLRILVQVNDKDAYALDLPAYLQGVIDSVLSQF